MGHLPIGTTMIVDVLVFRGIQTLYSYTVPNHLEGQVVPGLIVDIPLGRAKAKGLVITCTNTSSTKTLKPLTGITPKTPLIHPDLIDLILWFYHYYNTTPYKAYQTIIGNRKFRDVTAPDATLSHEPPPYDLNVEQTELLKILLNQKPGHHDYLIHGVTGSGKTEIYMQLAATMLERGKETLILLPEIALTPQFRTHFKKRFGPHIAVVHSGLTPKQRDEAWSAIYQGYTPIVIGPRSAIFSPFKDIGLIVIDEEHDASYKQDSHPRYYTHQVAKFRAEQHEALFIKGTATPALESYHYSNPHVLTLNQRVNEYPLPKVSIINMKDQTNMHALSSELKEGITDRLKKGEKTLILLNRRGYATLIKCQACGEVHTCPQCDLSFTYHQDKSLRCHRCDIKVPLTHWCSHCKKPRLAFCGTGIQKMELALINQFPQATLCRLDRDTAKTAKQLEAVLDHFKKEGDILIGTQLIAKGHHIEDITLVGVIGIDTVLSIPDFRAPERAFQLVTQVAGRAGRGTKAGEVIVQTYQPDHYALRHASTHCFNNFYKEELAYREQLWYPPFSKLINIILSSPTLPTLESHLSDWQTFINKTLMGFGDQIQILGPKPAPVERLKKYYRWNILIKYDPDIESDIKATLKTSPESKAVRTILDLDPLSIL